MADTTPISRSVLPKEAPANGQAAAFANELDIATLQKNVVTPGDNQEPRLATDNEIWPPILGTTVEDAPDQHGTDALRYKTNDGKDVIVQSHVNPELHQYLTNLRELNKSPEMLENVDLQQRLHKADVLRRESDLPELKDIKFAEGASDYYLIGTNDGKYKMVTRQLSPETYARAKAIDDTLDGIKKSKEEGYKLVNDNRFTNDEVNGATIGWENEAGPGLIRAEIFKSNGDSEKIIVSKELNPDLYGRLADVDSGRRNGDSKIDDARADADLPKVSDLDVIGMETTETDPNDENKKLTVGELTWQNLIKDWKAGIEDGSISKDDDRAKLYNALRAQAAAKDGLDMVVLDMSLGQSTARVTGADISSIVDQVKLDQATTDLFASESVQKDFVAKQKAAIEKLPNRDEVFDKLKDTAFSEDYIKYITDLKDNGNEGLAEADITKTYASLAAFDPDKAAEFAQSMMIDSTMIDLDRLIEDPTGINEDNTVLATQDVVKTVLAAIKKGGIDLPRRTVESIDKFANEFLDGKLTAKNFNSALQELGDKFIKNGAITQGDIDGLLKNGIYKALNEQTNGGFLSALSAMNNNGVLGSAGGLVSLASGIYQVAGKGGSLADTPEERLAIAKEMVSFLGAGQHFVNLGTNIYDKVMGSGVNKMMALDKSLPQIFGNDAKGGGRPVDINIADKFLENFDAILDKAPVADRERLMQKLDLTGDQTRELIKGMEEGFARNPKIPGSTSLTRGVSAFLRVMDAGANVFTGVADTVLGGLMIKKGADANDGVQIAQGAVQVAAGAFTLAGGASAGAALAGVTIARALTGPLLWAGALLSVALAPFMIVEDIKHNNRMDAHRDDLKDLFKDLDEQGVLLEDGGKRFEFLDEYMYGYGQRDAPDNVSIFEYRADEYEFYLRDGNLPNSFDDFEHKDYRGDGDNLDTRMDRGSTVGS